MDEMDAVAKRVVRLGAGETRTRPPEVITTETSRRHLWWRHVHMAPLVAGVTGGIISTVVLHPLDLIKIRFQVYEGQKFSPLRPQYKGIIDAVKLIKQQEGVRGLYKGITPNVWGAGSSWGLYFLFYNTTQAWLREAGNVSTLGPTGNMIAATTAGVVTLVLTNPIWVAKTRLCLQYDAHTMSSDYARPKPVHYSGMVHCMQQIYMSQGVRGLYKGFVPGLFGVSHGALQFMAYEDMKTRYNQYRCRPSGAQFNTLEYLTFAALSKVFAATTTYPYQVLRARLQDQHRSYTGVIDVTRTTYRFEGVRGFYKGLGPYLLHVTPNICIVFLIYELLSVRLRPPLPPPALTAATTATRPAATADRPADWRKGPANS